MTRRNRMIICLAGALLVAPLLTAAEAMFCVGTGPDREAALRQAMTHSVGIYLLQHYPEFFRAHTGDLEQLVREHQAQWISETKVLSERKVAGAVELYAEVHLNLLALTTTIGGPARAKPASAAGVKSVSVGAGGNAWEQGFLQFVDHHVVTHEEIINSGARNLADVLRWLPGLRISMNRNMSAPSSGPLVSDNQFSRLLVLMNGHRLNKSWNNGADQEWDTGFLEGLKEVRVYSGPQTVQFGSGAFDLVVDLITFSGRDLEGRTESAATLRADADRFDGVGLHLRHGDTFGEDGQYSVMGDFGRWNGQDVPQNGSWFKLGDRMGKHGPTYQVYADLSKGPWEFSARFLQNHQWDPHCCQHNWTYFYAEAARTFTLSDKWSLRMDATVDNIDTRFGDFRLSTTGTLLTRTSVMERREGIRLELTRKTDRALLQFVGEFRNDEVNEGPSVAANDVGFMEYNTSSGTGSLVASAAYKLTDHWLLQGAVRAEKSSYYNWKALPEVALQYQRGRSTVNVRYSEGQRYQDTWWRVGSGNYNAMLTPVYVPYVVPVKLDPEFHRELRGSYEGKITDGWSARAAFLWGQYRHLEDTDWDYVIASGFQRVQLRDMGGYKHWGGEGAVWYQREGLRAEANVSYQAAYALRLNVRELFVDPVSSKPLYLPNLAANFLADWTPWRHLTLAGRLNLTGGARNGGIDYTSLQFPAVYNTAAYPKTEWAMLMDLSVRLRDLWGGAELQFSFENLFNQNKMYPLVKGGYYYYPGTLFSATVRKTF